MGPRHNLGGGGNTQLYFIKFQTKVLQKKGHLICYSKNNGASGTEEEGVQVRGEGDKFKSSPGAMM